MCSQDLKIFKKLVSCEVEDCYFVTQLFEGCRYYTNASQLIDILKLIHKQKIKFSIVQGFKGTFAFGKTNEFRSCTIKLKNEDDVNKVVEILSNYELSNVKVKTKPKNHLVRILLVKE